MRQFIPPSVFVLFFTFFLLQNAFGQMDSLLFTYQDAIENAVSANEDASFDYDTEFEYLQDYIRKPLNINRAKATDFQNLRLLSPEQIAAIISHREKYGNFITLLELQGVLPLATIRKILPFVIVDGEFDDFQIPINHWFRKGKNDVFTRYERRLERAKGYKKEGNDGGFMGDANRFYARYRYSFGNRLSYGMTIEKDAGEPFRKSGFDFYSAHFQINNAHKVFKTIVLGDYSVSLGQGLIHENGFALGKSALVLSVEKGVPPLRFYSSSNEANFLRGIATTLQIGKNTEGAFFASYRQRDGNILNASAVDSFDNEAVISALQFSGLHRTTTEREDQNRIGLATLGGSIQRRFRRFSLGLNTVFNQFNGEIKPANGPYNFYVFKGKQLLNFSTNYKTTYQNIHAFGETAMSDNGGFATLNGLLIGLDKRLSMSILQHFFAKNYQALNAQPFAESSRTQDENGLFVGLEFKPNRSWTASFYGDFWQHKWLRFGVDAPSYGRGFFAKIADRTRNTEGYLQFRNKLKQENATRPDSVKLNFLTNKIRTQIRLQFNNHISKKLELRNRIEFSILDSDLPTSNGFAMWQDVIFKLENYPLSISSRLAFFDTKDYNSAIYAFENDVQYSFTVLPYYYRGSRFYLNASYRLFKNAYIETRFAQTYLTNRQTFGSGLDEIEGNKRTDIKVQFRVSF
jgi:Helix-hairpin-helix motif